MGSLESLAPSFPNPEYSVIDWGTSHPHYNSKAKKIPWSKKEIHVIGKWFRDTKKLGERNKATPSKFLADAKNHLDDIVPFVHITHALNPTRLAYGFTEYLKQNED